jgi:prolipoprotein diacylglyceryl transferase
MNYNNLAYIIWNVNPVMVRLGTLSIRWYSVFLMLSFFISYLLTVHIFKREDKPVDTLLSYGLFILAGLFVGGRLVHCLAYEPEYYLQFPWDIIKPWRGVIGVNAKFVGYSGMAGHGSALGIILGILLNSLRTKISVVWMLDRIALFGPLIGSFVRIGNLFNSEILGRRSEVPWAFIFVRADGMPRHPVQLYEAVIYLIIFMVSYLYYQKHLGREKPGAILGLVLVLVYSSRFFLEFFKDKQSDVELGMVLNLGHLLSIPFIVAGLILLFRRVKLKNSEAM